MTTYSRYNIEYLRERLQTLSYARTRSNWKWCLSALLSKDTGRLQIRSYGVRSLLLAFVVINLIILFCIIFCLIRPKGLTYIDVCFQYIESNNYTNI
mgnify:CR=1 FL=1